MGKTGGVTKRTHDESSALRLLRKVVATEQYSAEELARALVMSETALQTYLAGTKPIPLERQLCLAQFVIECIPSLARTGHRLRGQVAAAIAFHSKETATHHHAPASRVWPTSPHHR